jgi:hypothetical protein
VTFTIPDPRKHDDIVSAVVASDPDGDPVTLSYEWMIDGFVVPMASGLDPLRRLHRQGRRGSGSGSGHRR